VDRWLLRREQGPRRVARKQKARQARELQRARFLWLSHLLPARLVEKVVATRGMTRRTVGARPQTLAPTQATSTAAQSLKISLPAMQAKAMKSPGAVARHPRRRPQPHAGRMNNEAAPKAVCLGATRKT